MVALAWERGLTSFHAVGQPDALTYVSWDGPGAKYLRSLYLPIFAGLDVPVSVLQVSYGERSEMAATAQAAGTLGVGYDGFWFPRQTRASLANGFRILVREVGRRAWERPQPLVARSLVPAAACLTVGLPRRRFVFDADGLAADEKAEHMGWGETHPRYRAARLLESVALRRACVTATRTQRARETLLERGAGQVVVAPNGSDPNRFRLLDERTRREKRLARGLSDADVMVIYAGSIGAQYRPDLMREFVEQLRRVRRGRVAFRVLSGNAEAARRVFVGVDDMTIASVAPSQVAEELALADLAIALREPRFSQRAVSPVKLGEYLLCGLPVVLNAGVGDLDQLVGANEGMFVESLDIQGVRRAAESLDLERFDRAHVRQVGLERFSLSVATAGYGRAVAAALGQVAA